MNDDDLGNAEANELEALPTPPLATSDSGAFLIIKEEPSPIIYVPAESRTILVPRRR